MKRMREWVAREPLVLFLFLAALIYALWAVAGPEGAPTLVIDPAAIRALEDREKELRGRELSEEEREEILQAHIDDEVLVREAVRRGLHWSDYRVRQRLTQIMRSALTQAVADPTSAQLQAYFRDNIDSYTSPAAYSVEHILFPWGDDVDAATLELALNELREAGEGAKENTSSLPRPRMIPRASRVRLVTEYGGAFADAVEKLPIEEWRGPVESVRGIHLIRLIERHEPKVAKFEDVEEYLRNEWLFNTQRRMQQDRLDAIRARYQIEFTEE